MLLHVKQISLDEAKARAFPIRMRVFVREQGVPAEIELDADDRRARHFLATVDGKAVGTARLVLHRGAAKIGRMAVLKSFRHRSIGASLLKRAVLTARRIGVIRIYLHAQVPVIPFYEKLGFVCVGAVFDEAGIPHRKMVLKKATGSRQRATGKRGRKDEG